MTANRVGIVLLAVTCLAGAGVGVSWWARSRSRPLPPQVEVGKEDAELGAAIERERDKVLLQPDSARAWGELGMLLRGASLRQEAAVCFTHAATLDPTATRWVYLAGESLLPLDTPAALAALRRATTLASRQGEGDLTPALRLGEAYLAQGDLDGAEELISELHMHEPDNPVILFQAALLARSREDFASARDLLERCLEHPTTRRKARVALAAVCRRLGQDERAREHARQAAAFPADLPWPDPHLAACFARAIGRNARLQQIERLEAAGKLREAVRALRELLDTGPDYRVLVGLGKNLTRLGELDEARQVLDQAVRLDAEAARAYVQQGRLEFVRADRQHQAGEPRAAAASLSRAVVQTRLGLKRHPYDADAQVLLGRCLERLGEAAEAITAYREALRVSPDLGEAHLLLGEALARAGDRDKARSHLEQAARVARPDDPRARQALNRLGGK